MFNFFNKPKEPIKLWFSTDIHCHLVPGVDDGSKDVDTSVELVSALHEMGINRIITTPHVTQSTFENTPDSLKEPLDKIKTALATKVPDVRFSNSAEYRIDEFFEQQIAAGNLMPYPNNYLLIENSFIQEPWNMEQIIFDLQVRGYKLILAHPERYLYYHNRTQRYNELKQLDVSFQINLLSLAGYHGKHEKKMALDLAEAGMVDFIGTDTHGRRHINAFEEYLRSREARNHAKLLEPLIKNHIFD